MIRQFFLCISVLVILSTGCSKQDKQPSNDASHTPTDYINAVLKFRAEKDSLFRYSTEESPFDSASGTSRATFRGLNYFEPNADDKFICTLKRYDAPERITMLATKGDMRNMIRYGYFQFTLESKQYTLHVYKDADKKGEFFKTYLFIPFTDATTGRETYSTGRYLEFHEREGREEYELDFNYAYNPYCAYSDRYTCPIPPKENQLAVAIRAGEKVYQEH
jgi:uncharacterized protein (DUF1684 family)